MGKEKKIKIGLILIIGIILISSYYYIQISKEISSYGPISYYNIELDEEKAVSLLRSYIKNYIQYFGLNQNIEDVKIKKLNAYSVGVGSVAIPMYDGFVIFTDGKIAKISFTSNFVNEFRNDENISPVTNIPNFSDEKFFYLFHSCISSDEECIITGGQYLECRNALFYSEEKDNELSNYFSCKCRQPPEDRILMDELLTEINLSNCEECFTFERNELNSIGCQHVEGQEYIICKIRQWYTPYECILDFNVNLSKTEDNKLIVSIETPKEVPEITIKKRDDIFCKLTKSLNQGLNVIETHCSYEEDNCVRIFYKNTKISEVDCFYPLY